MQRALPPIALLPAALLLTAAHHAAHEPDPSAAPNGLARGAVVVAPWGDEGHRMVGATAAAGLPADVPAFFREAAPRLAWLNPEPDRWRGSGAREMDEAFKYDHYVDLENLPAGALEAPDRFEFLEALYRAGLEEPEQAAGFLPFRIIELYQRVENGFRRWREAASPEERRWIEERIINDAGILGHYIADASNPLHTTIHFNGWSRDAPNPQGYTTSRDLHWGFESAFVRAAVSAGDVARSVPAGAIAFADVRTAVMDYIHASHRLVVPLYELEKQDGFRPDAPTERAAAFAVERLAAAADMLRSVWYSAWMNSGR